jgi:Co/Zn/Cd efflux system component
VIALTGFLRADALASLLIGVLILPRTWKLLRETVDVLLEKTPKGLDLTEVRDALLAVAHVHAVHDLHASTVATSMPVLTAHIVVDDTCFRDGHARRCSTCSSSAWPVASTSSTPPSSSNRPATPHTSTRPTPDRAPAANRGTPMNRPHSAADPTTAPPSPATARRTAMTRRIRLLVATTITYNVIEAIVALTAGTIASSIALVGFGLDSVIEVASAAAVAWQFAGSNPERRERTALRIIAWSFFALAAYVTVEAARTILGATEAERSTVGIVLVAISVVVMPFLSLAQHRAGREFGSASAVADSKQTLLCTYLSAAVLLGLVLNAALAGGGPTRWPP